MQFALTPDQRNFFAKNHYIEFEELFSTEELATEKSEVDRIVGKRARKLPGTLTPKEMFMSGRDLFRETPSRKIYNQLGKIASILFQKPTVRLAFDQAIGTTARTDPLFSTSTSLQQISCVQPLLGGALVRLSADAHPPEIIPQQLGGALFFTPDFVFPWPSLLQTPHQSFLLIAFGSTKCLYVLREADLHTHALKRLGYGFGDSLSHETHPILAQKL